MTAKRLPILLVEDNYDHAELVKISIKNNNLANDVIHLEDGEQALDYIYKRGEFSGKDIFDPIMILLDLRMPKKDGLEVLKELKSDDKKKHIPIIILTTSANEIDISKAYEYNVNSYLVKPVDFNSFSKLIKNMGFYWLALNESHLKQNNPNEQ